MLGPQPHEGLFERIYWLIRLRWIAVIGVILTVLFANQILRLTLPASPFYLTTSCIAIYNLIFLFILIYLEKKKPTNLFSLTNRIANLQILFDLTCLAILIHFSGGIENPFIFYFIFHMIIASILLSRRAAFLQATFAVVLFCLIVTLEYFGFLPRYCLKEFVGYDLHLNKLYIGGVSFVFISTLYLATYMASSISVRLRQREKSLREANLLLEEKDRIKSEYVLRVSHDIKEHLSAIQSCIEPVAEGITGDLNSKQKGLIQRAEIEMDYFSLKKTVENAINFVEPRAKEKEISINCNIQSGVDMIKGAQVYIEETIANLLANSVKYTPKNGKVNISVEDRVDSILIQISDTGIGIPKAELPRIFEEFYRGRNAKEIERDGTGLGLSIAKQVVERHNGKIWVESEEGNGSTFNIILPK